MGKRTFLYDAHVNLDAKMVDFGGWDMPLHYGSQIEEHHAVRRDAGMFDVSHMTAVDVTGAQARDYLRYLLANDVDKLKGPGRAIYGCMLNERGGVIDDMITYWIDDAHYRVVVNASTTDKDLAWMRKQADGFDVSVEARDDLAIIAVQGPEARDRAGGVLPKGEPRDKAAELKRFQAVQAGDYFIARTGYTGEDGFEILLPGDQAASFWNGLREAGVQSAGLGARDTLRLEAGLNLYGQDMDEEVTPLESNLGWTVAFEPTERNFIGRKALEKQKEQGVAQRLVGLVLEDKGVLRHGMKVFTEAGEGVVTSGGFSPTLGVSIAFARVPRDPGERCEVEVRGRRLKARVVKPPFVKNGEAAEGIRAD